MVRRKQSDHRAETRGKGLSGLPHVVADSCAYLTLTPFERAVHAEMLRRFNGYNNGEIGISYEEMGARLKGRNACPPNNARIARAVATLLDHGLIAEPTLQSWLQRRARTYRLTYISSGKAPPYKSATNEYRSWVPREAKNDGDAGSPPKPLSSDAQSLGGLVAGDAGLPGNPKNGSYTSAQLNPPGDGESSLICIPYPSDAGGPGEETDPTNSIPESADGSKSAAHDLRLKIMGHYGKLSRKRQRSFEQAHGVSRDDIRHYLHGDPLHLPPAKVAAMLLAIRTRQYRYDEAGRSNQRQKGNENGEIDAPPCAG